MVDTPYIVPFKFERVHVCFICTSCPAAFVPPIIDAGVPSDIPLEIDRENFLGKIGSTLHVVEGQSATIPCEIFAGTGEPEGSVDYAWYYMGMQIMNGTKFMITVAEDKRSSTLMVNNFMRADNGQITCKAFNHAGQSEASSDVFGECYTHTHAHTHTHGHTHTNTLEITVHV